MTDSLERVFVEVCYEGETNSTAEVVGEVAKRLEGLQYRFSVTENKPARIFSDQDIEDRFTDLFFAAQLFKERFAKEYGVEIEIDLRLLYVATISAYDDIERYKSYHLEKPYRDRSDAVKRSAYLTKWISKIAPFQTKFDLSEMMTEMSAGSLKPDAKPALANILFSIMVSMGHISIDCKKRTWLSPEAEFHLSYDLLYRRVNEDALLATYQKIVDLVFGNEIIKH